MDSRENIYLILLFIMLIPVFIFSVARSSESERANVLEAQLHVLTRELHVGITMLPGDQYVYISRSRIMNEDIK